VLNKKRQQFLKISKSFLVENHHQCYRCYSKMRNQICYKYIQMKNQR